MDRNRAVVDFSVRNQFTLAEGEEDEDSISLQIKKSRRWGQKSKCPSASLLLTPAFCVDSVLGSLVLGGHGESGTGVNIMYRDILV